MRKEAKHIELIAGTLYSHLKWEEPAELTDDERKLYELLRSFQDDSYDKQS